MAISKQQKALIHIAKQQCGLREEDYRAMLHAEAGVESSKDLTQEQYGTIMHRFERMGFVSTSTMPSQYRNPPPFKERMMRKIAAIMKDLNLPSTYADGIARRMFGIEKVAWCDTDQIYKILAALCIHQKKVKEREKKTCTV